jgi:predicted aspartyl protease
MNFNTSLKPLSRLFCLTLLLTFAYTSAPGTDTHFSSGKSSLAIPFELEDNLIYVAVSINGSKPLSFILDTGAFTIVDLRRAQELGLKLKHTGQTDGVGDARQDVFLATTKVSYSLPGVTLSNQRLLAVSLEKAEGCIQKFVIDAQGRGIISSNPAEVGAKRKVDGILGKEFFSNFVVEIDYAARLINVYEPGNYKYSGQGEKLAIEVGPQHIFVQAKVFATGRPPVIGRLMVDTGSGMAVTLTKSFTDEHQLLPQREKLTTTPVCGIAGTMKIQSLLGSIEAVELGTLKITDPLVEFRQASIDYPFDGYIGAAVFRRYKVVFDYSRRLMVMEGAKSTVNP